MTIEAPYGMQLPQMTLRDYFAAKCVAAMISTIHNDGDYSHARDRASRSGLPTVFALFAAEAYNQADVVLHTRSLEK